MVSRICASIIPEVHSVTKQADQAFELGADYVEIRFDFIRPEELDAAISCARHITTKSVFTLRSKDQGGKFEGSEQDRVKWLYKLAEQKPMLIDIELETLQRNDELADSLEKQKTPVLVTWHDFSGTPSKDRIAEILSEMRIYSNYVKIVTTARSVEDSLRLLEMYEMARGLHPIFFAMGESGIISRLLCTVIGNAPFTYASVEKAVAPGQLTVSQMRKLYDGMRI